MVDAVGEISRVVPENTFLGTQQVLLDSRWGQVGLLAKTKTTVITVFCSISPIPLS